MTKGSARGNKKHAVGSHSTKSYAIGAFDKMRNTRDGKIKTHAQIADDPASDEEQGFDCTNGHGNHRESGAVSYDEDRATVVRHDGLQGHVVNKQSCSSDFRELRRAHSVHYVKHDIARGDYEERSVNLANYEAAIEHCDDTRYSPTSEDERDTQYHERSNTTCRRKRERLEGTAVDSDYSDCDSTDAINYYSDSDTGGDEIDGDDYMGDGSIGIDEDDHDRI